MSKQIKIISPTKYLAEALSSSEMFEIAETAKLEVIDHGKIVEVGSEKFQKPVILKDLVAAINRAAIPEKVEFKEFVLYAKLRKATVRNSEVQLTEKEVSILLYLIDTPYLAANKADMLRDIWGANEQVETKTLETHIYRLRQKFEALNVKNLLVVENESIKLDLTNI